MSSNLEVLAQDVTRSIDIVTINFYKNGSESIAYNELNLLFENLSNIFQILATDPALNDIMVSISNIVKMLNDVLENDDTLKICGLLYFELKPILENLTGVQGDTQ